MNQFYCRHHAQHGLRRYSLRFVLLLVLSVSVGSNTALFAAESQSDLSSQTAQAAKGVTISGQVTDSNGETLVGVAVVVKGSNEGCSTDVNGRYSIKLSKAEGAVLLFSYLGMDDMEVALAKGQSSLDVAMKSSSEVIDEVVVTSGYFNQSKATFTGSATAYQADNLRKISTSNMLTTLSMVDPTFNLTENIAMGSDPNAMPEYTIRGGGSLESEYSTSPNQPTFILDGFEVSTAKIFDLDPNRIASVTILKDASATAIYGSRAANGVVVIETVAPKEGELRVTYNFSGDLSVADLTDYALMNSSEKLKYEAATGMYYSSNVNYRETLMETYNQRLGWIAQGINTDWMAKPINSVAFSQKHFIMVEGGDKSLRYSLNANYNDMNGVMKESGRDVVSIGAKLQYVTGSLRFSNDVTYSDISEQNSPYGSFSTYTQINPYYYPYNEDGSVKKVLSESIEGQQDIYTQLVLNPLYNATIATKDITSKSEFTDNLAVEWNPISSFRMKGQLSLTKSHSTDEVFLPATHTSFYDKDEKGSYRMKESDDFSYDANLIASYNKSFGDHALSLNGVYNVQQTEYDYYSVLATNFPNDNMDHVGMGTQYETDGRPKGDYLLTRMMGVACNLNYSYNNRYMLDFSVRSDASSLFGANNRWGTFGSFGAAWNMHNEDWLYGNDNITELKIRGSIGSVGGQDFYSYQALTMFSYNDSYVNNITYNDMLGALVMAYGNENLEWQRTYKRNIGVDFTLFDSRFSGSVDFYNDRSESVLIDVLLAPSTGFGSYTENLGEVENKGFELNMRYTVLKGRNGLQLDLFGSAIHNKNQLLSINDALIAFNEKADENEDESTAPPVRYQVGESINTIWANRSLGIDSFTGEEIFLTPDGERVNEWKASNYEALGCKDPDIEGNFGTMLMYRGFQLNAYFSYSIGGDIYNQTMVDKVENVSPLDNADIRVLYDRWTTPGVPAQYKAIGNSTTTYPSSRFIERENFLRLSSLSLSYYLGDNLLKKLGGAEQCKLTASANNIFRASTVKMERGTSYPYANTVSLSAQITF